jgi:hypothetical protein
LDNNNGNFTWRHTCFYSWKWLGGKSPTNCRTTRESPVMASSPSQTSTRHPAHTKLLTPDNCDITSIIQKSVQLLVNVTTFLHYFYFLVNIITALSVECLGGACSVHGRGEGCIQHFGWEAWREETTRKT